MLLEAAHRVVARPWFYERAQTLAGAEAVRRRVGAVLDSLAPIGTVLDLGGGTGAIRRYIAPESRYICLDMEMPKLEGFKRRRSGGSAILCDCTRIPIASGAVDVALCMLMSHHLTDSELRLLLLEARRVLSQGGRFVFLDCVRSPERMVGRFLWSVDRGSHPRSPDALAAMIEPVMPCIRRERFAIWHEYWLLVCMKRS
ncbi:MAG TPA: methyltransferase domain-containing protein [Bryobacteraceae bacterium]|nr:methyltransferase domain-containing protein [Bryobacteraceae bacterium]